MQVISIYKIKTLKERLIKQLKVQVATLEETNQKLKVDLEAKTFFAQLGEICHQVDKLIYWHPEQTDVPDNFKDLTQAIEYGSEVRRKNHGALHSSREALLTLALVEIYNCYHPRYSFTNEEKKLLAITSKFRGSGRLNATPKETEPRR